MKYYFVSNGAKNYLELLEAENCKILVSYYSMGEAERKLFENYPNDIFLDCGAFSAWTLDKIINLEEYIKFVKEKESHYERIASLDEIPKDFSEIEKKRAGEQTYKNYMVMKEHIGLKKLVPVYHFGEDFGLLEQYVKEGADLIGLGGIAGSIAGIAKGKLDVRESLGWFAEVFKTFPKQKFHGMGIFSKEVLFNFPLYSTDSTHWLLSGRYGHIIKFNRKTLIVNQIKRMSQKSWIKVDELGGTREGFFKLVEGKGQKSKYIERAQLAIREIKEYINFITRLWEARGIVWEE